MIVRRGLTIRGAGAERSAIERRGTALTRLFVVMHPNAVLQDLTLRNGDWQRAGMAYGGAVWTRGGLIERCLITNNILGGWGGAGPADGVVFDGTVSQDSCIADTVSDNLGALIMTNVYTNAVLFLTNAVDGGMGLTVAGPIEVYSGHLVFTGNTTMINGGTPSAPWGMGYALRRRACMWPPALRSMPMDVAFGRPGTGETSGRLPWRQPSTTGEHSPLALCVPWIRRRSFFRLSFQMVLSQ